MFVICARMTIRAISMQMLCPAPADRSWIFVNWLKAQPFYENTTIVIVGDHLTMDSDFCQDVPEDYTRGVYNTIINAPIVPVNQKQNSDDNGYVSNDNCGIGSTD